MQTLGDGENGIVNPSNWSITWGTGNIETDPLFVDASNGKFRLSNISPAIGSGTTTGAPSTDIDGNPRPYPSGTNPDMGAYEM